MIRTSLAVITAAGALSSSVRADDTVRTFSTGNDLYTECASQPLGPMALQCQAYIAGAMDAIMTGYTSRGIFPAKSHAPVICPPTNLVVAQALNVVVTYLRDHPERRLNAAPSEIWHALVEAWPCKS